MSESLGPAAAMVRLSFLVQSIYGDVAEKHGLTVAQAQLMCVVMETGRGMSDVAAMLRLEKSSLSGLVDRAEQRGFLVRQSEGDDRRATKLVLSATGLRLTEAFYAEVSLRLREVVGTLPPREEARFVELASRLVLSAQIPAVFGASTAESAASDEKRI